MFLLFLKTRIQNNQTWESHVILLIGTDTSGFQVTVKERSADRSSGGSVTRFDFDCCESLFVIKERARVLAFLPWSADRRALSRIVCFDKRFTDWYPVGWGLNEWCWNLLGSVMTSFSGMSPKLGFFEIFENLFLLNDFSAFSKTRQEKLTPSCLQNWRNFCGKLIL